MALTITGNQAAALVANRLGGTPEGRTAIELANDAGVLLCGVRQWNWAVSRRTGLDYVRVLTFTSGSAEPSSGDVLTGATSGATATVSHVHLTGGAWVDGDASGTIDVVSDSGTFEAENLDNTTTAASDVLTIAGATSSASHIDLPADCEKILALHPADSVSDWFREVTFDHLLELRSSTVLAGPPYFGTLLWDSDDLGAARPRLELWPAPNAATVGALNLYYRRGWAELAEDDTAAKIPDWMVPVYRQFIVDVARGWEDDLASGNATDAYLAATMQGVTFRGAEQRDANAAGRIGVPRNGMYGHGARLHRITGTMQGPT